MYVSGHHVADGFVDEAMPTYDRQAAKTFRHDLDREVAPAIRSTRVPRVLMAIVHDLQREWHETLRQSRGESCGTRGHIGAQGSTLRNGWTSHDSKTPAVT